MTTKAVQAHRDRVVALGCFAMDNFLRCCAPATFQHARAGSLKERGFHRAKGMKNSDWLGLPICPRHHYLEDGADGSMGIQTWESRHGKQADMIDELCLIFDLNLWDLARAESKGMVPRRPLFLEAQPN